jgi:trehalose 6-phosphate phosphatase
VSTEEQRTSLEDPAQLATALGPASRWLMVLDFDGTLSPIVEHPDDAAPAAGAVDAIGALTDTTTVAIVSGRPVAELRARLGDLPVTFAGGHGAEVVTDDGTVTALVDDPDGVRATLDDAEQAVAATIDDEPGWLVERKDASLAVHHRRVPPAVRDRMLPEVVASLEAHLGSSPGFDLLEGKAVLELRPAGVDKGRAVAWIADRAPGLSPLVLGDDVTDEDAFREAARRGGASILVAERPRATVARWRLRDPQEVVTFLTALAASATGRPDGG